MAELNFSSVEALRKHMLLSSTQMAKYLKVSRLTYVKWVKGGSLRKANAERTRKLLSTMLEIMQREKWPSETVANMPPSQRFILLLKLSGRDEEGNDIPSTEQTPAEETPVEAVEENQ